VSTRQPVLLEECSARICVKITFNNERVATNSDIIFLCCLPFHLDYVMKDIKRILKERTRITGKQPMIISILAEVNTKKISQAIGKLANNEDYKAILTTKINTKKLKTALSKDSEKVTESLGRVYKRLSPTLPDNEHIDTHSEDPSEDIIVVEEFVTQEAAGGLTFKRGLDILNWLTAFKAAFPEIEMKNIVKEVLGKEYEDMTYEELLE